MLKISAAWQPCHCEVCTTAQGREAITGWVAHFADPPQPRRADMHQAFEVGVLLEGAEEKHFGEQEREVHVGDAWLIPGCEVHAWRPICPHSSELTLHFLPEVLGDETFEGRSWLHMFACPPAQRPRTEAERAEVLRAAEELRREVETGGPALAEGLRIGLLRLLLELYRSWELRAEGNKVGRPAGRLGRIMPAVNLAYASGARRIGLAEAAQACGLTPSHFDQVFRETMGTPFARFEVRRRLVRASRLLTDREVPVEAVAQRTGFTDASHLHRRFAEVYGCTPGQYRAKAQGAEEPS